MIEEKEITNRQQIISDKFETLKQERQKIATRLQQIDNELLMLQGEYRALKSLIDEDTKVKKDNWPGKKLN